MSKDNDKRLKEKEKLDTEVARSLSVVKVKEAHKQIEDIEKARKKASISSIIMRLNSNIKMAHAVFSEVNKISKENPKISLSTLKLESGSPIKAYIDLIISTFESIRFDLEENIDVNKQDFDRLFPKINLKFDTYGSIVPNLTCLGMHMKDIKNYCSRLI